MIQAALDRVFHLRRNKTTLKTELLAGLSTFSTMVYIIFVNPRILSEAGMEYGSVMTATIIAACTATLYMGYFANYPFALAPGMGLNAYFAYSIVLEQEHSWETALGACFIAGVLFLLLNLLGIREIIIDVLPFDLRLGTAAGIGLFLAFIGCESVDLVAQDPYVFIRFGSISEPPVLLTGCGIAVISIMLFLRISGAIMLSVLLSWATGLALGLVEWQGFVALPPTPTPTLLKLDVLSALSPELAPVILTLVFVAVFDTAGSLLALAHQGKFLTQEGKIPRVRSAMNADAFGTILGSLAGTAPFTTYLESATGIIAGGRTGLTAIVVAVLFFFTLFISPFAQSVPSFATAPALIVIGVLMAKQARGLNWSDPTEFLPGFVTMIGIPLTFSIGTGVALGFITFPALKLATGRFREISWIVWVVAAIFGLKFVNMV